MHIFDYSFLENGVLPAEIVNLTSAISAFNAISENRKEKNINLYAELEKLARVESVKSSNAIEGIVTTDARIKEIVNAGSAPLNHSEREIAGYRDAFDKIHNSYETMNFSKKTILDLHKKVTAIAGYKSSGKFKTEDNLIMEIDAFGKRRVRFTPVSAAETEEAIDQLILAYIDARDNPNINQLLLIPCVILDFLCIHPFADGNGRISRLFSLLLLYKNGFDIAKYISFEEQINISKEYYYSALEESSEGWHENENSYTEFMKNFLSTLYKCFKELDKRFSSINGKKLKKNERIEATVLNSVLPISKADICNALIDVSPTTVEAVLGKMVKSGSVLKIGSARATKYVKYKERQGDTMTDAERREASRQFYIKWNNKGKDKFSSRYTN